MDMSHTGHFYFFLQLATQHFVAVAGFKTGVLHVKSFLQLVSQQRLQEKLPRVTWPIASKLEKIGPIFSSFNPFPSLPSVATDGRKQFQCRKIVFNNKTRPLFLEFSLSEDTI